LYSIEIMSVANIFGPDGKIGAAFLPVGVANNYVDNPMAETLDGGGFDMVNIDDISCSGVTAKDFILTDGIAGFGTLSLGASPTYPVLCNKPITVSGAIKGTSLEPSGGAILGGAVQCTSLDASGGAILGGAITASGTVQGATVASTGAIQGVSVTATGTVQGATVASTGNITAVGTNVPSQWNSFPQVADGTVLTWSYPATSFVIYSVASTPAGVYMGSLQCTFNKTGVSTPTSNISFLYNNSTGSLVFSQTEQQWTGPTGITAYSFLFRS
jgi:hypothetical protein